MISAPSSIIFRESKGSKLGCCYYLDQYFTHCILLDTCTRVNRILKISIASSILFRELGIKAWLLLLSWPVLYTPADVGNPHWRQCPTDIAHTPCMPARKCWLVCLLAAGRLATLMARREGWALWNLFSQIGSWFCCWCYFRSELWMNVIIDNLMCKVAARLPVFYFWSCFLFPFFFFFLHFCYSQPTLFIFLCHFSFLLLLLDWL